jgi:hypothetical protein
VKTKVVITALKAADPQSQAAQAINGPSVRGGAAASSVDTRRTLSGRCPREAPRDTDRDHWALGVILLAQCVDGLEVGRRPPRDGSVITRG